MVGMSLDAEMHQAMSQYLMASNRLHVAEERGDQESIALSQLDQQVAATAYEDALVRRGWRAPTVVFAAR